MANLLRTISSIFEYINKKIDRILLFAGRRDDMYCISYVIKKGDSLFKISRQFNVGINELMKANPLVNVYSLRVDDVLCIPMNMQGNNFSNNTNYLVEDGDSLATVLGKNNSNIADFMTLNDPKDIMLLPGSTLKVPAAEQSSSEVAP